MPELNPSVRYFAEVHYITPHEYNVANGNQHNNVSHRELAIDSVASGVFSFIEVADAVSESPALDTWAGATQVMIEPQPGFDGRAFLGYEVTQLAADLWHYEYAVYNMNMDQSIGALTVPISPGVTLSNIDFHAVLNHEPELNAENYTNDPWDVFQDGASLQWATTPYGIDPMANALRYGTTYNFRFDADAPPNTIDITVGLFKPGPVMQIQLTAVAPVSLCAETADCADLNADGIRDDNCVWWSCSNGGCGGTAIPFGDMGGEFGDCVADLAVDGNDRFHALNCFSNTSTTGVAPYPCEPAPPSASNVDAGGAFGDCTPDGVCDANDAFHALNAFEGLSTCSCPASGPAPQRDARQRSTRSR